MNDADQESRDPNFVNEWHPIAHANSEPGELIETPYFTEQDAKCTIGDEVFFRPHVNIRSYLSKPDARFTGRIEKVSAGHEIVYTIRVFPEVAGLTPDEHLFEVPECDCAKVGG